MGGQNTAACAYSSTPVPNPNLNICPSGWRLPTGSSGGDFQILNTNINDGRTNTDAGLLSKGLFNIAGIGIIALIIKEIGVDIGLQPKVQ